MMTNDRLQRAATCRFCTRLFMATFAMACAARLVAEEAAPPIDDATRWNLVERRARELAERPYESASELPASLKKLDYDAYRQIVYRRERDVWRDDDAPFRLETFHRGYIFPERVVVNVDDGRGSYAPVPFDVDMFQYGGKLPAGDVPSDLGFAGFRVLGKYATSTDFEEVASFLGASYFRAIGAGQAYGTSARGLAIDIGLPQPEEFPAFREFWIARPAADAESLSFAALLDSPSVAGAYEFQLRPGTATTVDVRARLFFRRRPDKIGLAPLSSMWMWGDGRPGPSEDPRPEVHDADGLLVATVDGEWIWRSLNRLDYPSVSRYDVRGIRGFGLMQRDQEFAHYADEEAKYHARPGIWIEPKSVWRDGVVELLELPAEHEGVDNIAAWWTPREPIDPAQPLDLEYTVSFTPSAPEPPELARVTALRVAPPNERRTTIVEIDFTGGRLNELAADMPIVPEAEAWRGTIVSAHCEPRPDAGVRLTLEIRADDAQPVELRAVLKLGDQTLSETWRYLCRTH